MGKRILKFAVLVLVFLGGNLLFSNLMNTQSTESASDLPDPTLPVVYINLNGVKVNEMHGYTMEMDGRKLRESIIPLTTDRNITVSYKAFGTSVESVSYEVFTPDTGEMVENGKISNFKDDGDSRTATFSLSEPLLMNREYPIRFILRSGGADIYYYARLLQRADLVISQYLEFVNNFYQTCLNKQAAGELKAYIEPDDTVQNRSFANVNIHSSLEMITWGDLRPQLFRKAVPKIREINAVTCTITCDYLISAPNGRGGTEIYYVTEYYRLRYYNSVVYLLNFERQALQEFDAANSPIQASGVNLGISTRDVQFKSDESSRIVAFVQNGGLWEFQSRAEKLIQIFSFHSQKEGSDERSDNINYGIRILNVAANGDVDFLVYGYMSRGLREGMSGISLYHYSAERVNLEERAFVPYQGSDEVLAESVEKLSYLSADGVLFLFLDDTLLRVNTEDETSVSLLAEIQPDCFVTSRSGRFVAWMNEMDPSESRAITLMNLETGDQRRLTSVGDTYLRALGFINDDLIYGVAEANDREVQATGRVLFAMKAIYIIGGEDGVVLKEYNPGSIYVSDLAIEEGLLRLTRVRRGTNGKFIAAPSDDIMNNKQVGGSEVKAEAKASSRQGTIISLNTPIANTNVNPLVSFARIRTPEREVVVDCDIRPSSVRRYFIYAYGGYVGATTDPAQAVRRADEMVGVVIDEIGRYIYERGNKETKVELGEDVVPAAFLLGTMNCEALEKALPDMTALDLTGCSLEQVLYLLSSGSAVRALREDGSTVVIVGYDRWNLILYDTLTGKRYYVAQEDIEPELTEAGSRYLSYLEMRATVRSRAS
ncbi:MAG: hypothetical protein IIY46_01170 [Lachnospiraceae bacterium]|nr:hypothetical protein [Lachnospiraceae bacterium]